MEDLMKLFERFCDTYNEIGSVYDTEVDRKEYEDLNTRSAKGERFVCRNYLSDWYPKLTQEQKKTIAQFQILFCAALAEDDNDREYNLQNYDMLHNDNNFSIKG